jgi:site-specific DNA-methyltransferase (adenine-specific)
MSNKLYYGNNLEMLERYVPDESVDLIYLDPPFKSDADYNILFREQDGQQSSAQIRAFTDTWRWSLEAEKAYHQLLRDAPERLVTLMQALREYLRPSDMLAYLVMMAPRLVELRRVLKPKGSIYLHCDPTASHYLKLLMDAVFGPTCFLNEVIWSYRRWPSQARRYQRMHDVIFFYSRTPAGVGTFNVDYEPNSPSYEKRFKGKTQMLDPETGTRKITLEQESRGLPRRDVWELSIIAGSSKERLGYPTQKPESLLTRIIQTSSNEGDVVLDPFCGCGTSITVAERLKRRWIGIDVTHLAISIMRQRLRDTFGKDLSPYEVIGEPTDVSGAQALAGQDRYQFQWWVVGKLGVRPAQDKKKGADSGIDGYYYFYDGGSQKPEKLIVQVKSGHVGVGDIRDLIGTMTREKAAIAAFVTLEPPTGPMLKEAAGAGFYQSAWMASRQFPRLQILTVEEVLAGKKIEFPPFSEPVYKQAVRQAKGTEAQASLFGERAAS